MSVPDSFAPPGAAPAAPAAPTSPCEACGQVFALRAASCPRCAFQRAGSSGGLPLPAGSKKPRSAMWLSLGFPGAGHLYAGDTEKGAILCGASALSFVLSATVLSVGLGVLLWLALALYTAIDSGRAVDAHNARKARRISY